MKHRWLLVAAAASLAGAAGCYKTPKPSCTFSCGSSGECPTDYMCGPDQVCHLVQSGGGLAACDHPFDDAATADAPVADASIADAPLIDGHPDGMFDGMPDGMFDANLCPALAIMDDGTQGTGGQDLVISLVQPNTGGKIELYNTTAADIDLSASTDELEVPGQGTLVLSTTAVVVKAHGYNNVTWPASFTDETGGGELVLYGSAGRTGGDIRDFICWDTDGTGGASVKATAQAANKWSTATPACAATLTGTAIERKNDVTGTLGSDYNSASTRAARSCP